MKGVRHRFIASNLIHLSHPASPSSENYESPLDLRLRLNPDPTDHLPQLLPSLTKYPSRDHRLHPHHLRRLLPLNTQALAEEDRADSANEDEAHKHAFHVGILGKARDARDAWKRHQRDAKHEKLKQSIKMLGPTDPGGAATYVRPQARGAVYECVDGVRIPIYMSGGMF